MSEHSRKRRAGSGIAIFLIILFIASLVFNVYQYITGANLRTERDKLVHLNETANENLTVFQTQMDSIRDEKDALKAQIASYEETIDYLQERLNTKTKTGIDPDAPAYTKDYPNFYVSRTSKATEAPANTVYLTFDDGPSERTEEILEILAQYDIKATFFVVKKGGETSAVRLKAIADAGHTIGMHTASHNYQTIYASVDAFLKDQNDVFTWIQNITGQTPSIFRFPGGSINSYNHSTYQEIIAEMVRRGFIPYDWNVSSGDADKNTVEVEKITENILAGCRNMGRSIVLMHDGVYKTTTVEALPTVIEALTAEGYTFAPLTAKCKPTLFQYIDKIN